MPRTGNAVGRQPRDVVSDHSEDELDSRPFEGSIFQSYIDACSQITLKADQEDAFQRGVGRVKEYLAGGGDGGVCLICLSAIRPDEALWSCQGGCFTCFHLPCIQEWARNQLDAMDARAAQRLSPASFPAAAAEARAAAEWACPKCRQGYPSTQIPRAYTCFCGKQQDPTWDPWLAPHTCGEICGRKLPGGCKHTCMLLCHPGPCPPCPLVVPASCPCGKNTSTRRCGAPEPSCGAPCQRPLACGHRCSATCHEGACPPCPLTAPTTCPCGAETQQVPCSERPLFRCHRECGKLLSCGRHHCTQVCHSGACGGCPSEGPRTCPCGKQTHTGLQCDERAPTCGDTCGQLLQCGLHCCTERCHHGACTATCRATVSKICRCGKSAKAVQCGEEVRCERRCSQMRSCGRHPCRRRCCDGDCPPCEETCGKKLRCRNHKCPAPCHLGPCRPCPLTTSVTCACGRTATTLPCGAEAEAAPPRCFHPCPIPPLCRHAPSAKPHRCHFGSCPPCTAPCSNPLACGHHCSSQTCHDLALPPVPPFAPPKPPKSSLSHPTPPPAPAVVAAAAAEQLRPSALTPCPPCEAPAGVECLGGHTTRQLPCSSAAPFCCGAPCGHPLSCTNHTCQLPCHTPEAPAPAASPPGLPGPSTPTPCQQCSRACDKPRSCPHPCPQPCHPGPCPPCQLSLKTKCHCGKTPLSLPCHQHRLVVGAEGPLPPDLQDAAQKLLCGKPCTRPLPSCPHSCTRACHPGACPDADTCSEQVPVRCSCRQQKQYWPCHRVRQALAAAGEQPCYGPATALRLLPCTGNCATVAAAAAADAAAAAAAAAAAVAAANAAGRTNSSSKPKAQQPEDAAVAWSTRTALACNRLCSGVGGWVSGLTQRQSSSAAAAGQEGGLPGEEVEGSKKARRLPREERERLAAERVAAQERALVMKKRKRWLRLGGVAGVGLLLALLIFWVLQKFDQQATAKWQPSSEL